MLSQILRYACLGLFPCWMLFVAACTSSSSVQSQASEPATRPVNVIIINADDLGFGDLGCYGATHVQTPHIDRLATQGRRFTDAHSASSVCTPSRFALMTGTYPFRNALWAPIFLRAPLIIDPETMTIARVMQESGYTTACIGKWHLGFGSQTPVNWNEALNPGPIELGFDHFFGVPVVNSHPPFVYVEDHFVVGLDPADPMTYGQRADTQPYPEKFQLGAIGGAREAHRLYEDEGVGTILITHANQWVREQAQADKPFFLYLATTNIHHPFTPAPQFQGTSECGRYGDFIHELDWMVGELMQTLEDLGIADNTLVIFTSDNGGMLNQGGQDAWGAGHRMNGEFLGFKFDAWEGGHRIPLIVRWPGQVSAGSESAALISNVDFVATLAELVGHALGEGIAIDSVSQLPALVEEPDTSVRDELVLSPFVATHIALRRGDWLYIPAQGNGGFSGVRIGEHTLGGPPAHLLTQQVNSDIIEGKIRSDAPPRPALQPARRPQSTRKHIRNPPRHRRING